MCIAKNLKLDNFKGDFPQYFDCLHPQIPDFQIAKYCPILTNHTQMGSLFIQLSDDVAYKFQFKKIDPGSQMRS